MQESFAQHIEDPGHLHPCQAHWGAGDHGCPAGQLCVPSSMLAEQLIEAGIEKHPVEARHGADEDNGWCQPCAYGQFCPAGSFLPKNLTHPTEVVSRFACRWAWGLAQD